MLKVAKVFVLSFVEATAGLRQRHRRRRLCLIAGQHEVDFETCTIAHRVAPVKVGPTAIL